MYSAIDTTAQDISLHIWKWFTIHRKTKIVLMIAALCTMCSFFNQQAAIAAETDTGTSSTLFLPLGNITDSHGVPLSAYSRLPLDYGNVTYPGRVMRGFIVSILWAFYVLATFIIIATVDFILGLTWLDWLLSPFTFLASTISATAAKLFIIPLALTCSALAGAILWARGAKSAALIEVFVALVLSAVAVSPAADPINYISGEQGAITRSVEYGNELGNIITTEPNSKEENTGIAIGSSIIDVALRTPAQVLSWGKSLDGECVTTFDDAAKEGKDPEEIRKAVNGCDEAAKEGNETDSALIFGFFLIFTLGFVGLWAVVIVMIFFIVKDALFAMINAINVTWRAILAVFPWGTRYSFYNSFAQMVVNVVAVGACITVTAVYLWLYGQIVARTNGTIMVHSNTILGIIAAVLAWTLWRMKKNGKTLGQALAERIARLGTTRSAQATQPSKIAGTVKGFARDGAHLGGKYLASRTMISAGTKLAAGVATGGTAAVAATIATTAANTYTNPKRSTELVRPKPFINASSLKDYNGAFPMPPANQPTPQPKPQPKAIETTGKEPPETPTTPALPHNPNPPETPHNPSKKTTLNPSRYDKVRIDIDGNPHTILEGEIIDENDPINDKINTLKKLNTYDGNTIVRKQNFF